MTDIRRNFAWHGIATAIALAITATGVAMLIASAGPLALCSIFAIAAALSSWRGGWSGAAISIGTSILLLGLLLGVGGWSIFAFAGVSLALSAAVIMLVSRSGVESHEPDAQSPASDRVALLTVTDALTFDRVPLDRGAPEEQGLTAEEEPEATPVDEARVEAARRAAEDEGRRVAEEARLQREREARQGAERLAAEVEALRLAEKEKVRREQEARQEAERLAAEAAAREEARRAAEEARLQHEREAWLEAERLAAEAEALRLAEQERARREQEARLETERLAAEAAAREEARRAAEEARLQHEREAWLEAERLAAEAEALRLAEQERARREQEARLETERLAAEVAAREEAQRIAEGARLQHEREAWLEAERLAAEAEARRLAEQERALREQEARLETERLSAEVAVREEAQRIAEEARLQREREVREEAERLAAEAEALRLAEQERARREQEARLEAERVAAEVAAREEAQRTAEEARLQREREVREEAERLAAEAEALRLAEQERVRREQEARLEAERRAAEAAAEEEARRVGDEMRLQREQAIEVLRLAGEERARHEQEARPEDERRAADADPLRLAEEERKRLRRQDDERFARELEEARIAADEAAQRQVEEERARLQREAEERQARELEEGRLADERRVAEARAADPEMQLRLVSEREAGADEGYTVVCFTCQASFEAEDADWCSCLTKRRTLICTNCLTCFCKAPPAYAEGFWVEAPPGLLARRNASEPQSSLARNPEPGELGRPLVLSVEDDEEIQLIVQRVCLNLGYSFIHAESGRDGMALARRYRPDLILSDDFLPDLDGREMGRLLKQEIVLGDWTMVVMTGVYTDLKYRAEALQRFHIDDYVSKPVAITDLISLLERHLEGVTGLPEQEDLHELHRAMIDQPPEREGDVISDLREEIVQTLARSAPTAEEEVAIFEAASEQKAAGDERYEVACFHCGEWLDAAHADWCAHLERDPTIVCWRCGKCFCDASASFRQRFWMNAPSTLFERRMILAKRDPIPPVNPSPEDVPRPLILLIEDDENIRLIVRTVVTTMGFGVIATADGPEGLALAGDYHPDLILVDTFVPNLDGWQFCRLLRIDPATALVKAVIMTGLTAAPTHQDDEAPSSLDVDDYVAKPLAVADLVNVIRKHLRQDVHPAM